MSIKINSLMIPNNVIEKMKSDLYTSYKTDLEHGFSLCTKVNSDIIIDRSHCTGEKCRIKLQRKCNQDENFVGSYHTHPGGDAVISAADMMTSCLEQVSCIGGNINKIKCHVRKRMQPEWKEHAQQLRCYYDAEGFHNTYETSINKRFDDIQSESVRLKDLINRSKKGENIDKIELNAQIMIHNNKIKQFTKDSLKFESILEKLISKYFDIIDINNQS